VKEKKIKKVKRKIRRGLKIIPTSIRGWIHFSIPLAIKIF
jgi:hypothetical protein